MSYAIPGIYEESVPLEEAPQDLIFIPRSKNQWIYFIGPLALCAISWSGGGVPFLTDVGFLIFTVVCGIFLTLEFARFPRRFGIGGLVLYGGTLCWFCQDYFTNWWNADFTSTYVLIPAWVVAKAATLHVLFVMLMAVGLNFSFGRWLERVVLIVPDPGDSRFYVWILLALFCCSLCPYVVFNDEPWYLCIYHALFAGWVGEAKLTVYRTGNINYSWGAYVAQIMAIGSVGGIIAIIYAILIAKSWPTRLLGFGIWLFNMLIGFSSGRRGEIAFHLLPPIAMLFIKYQARAAMMFKKSSVKAFIICGLLTVVMQAIVQFQGTYRGVGYANADASKFELTKNQGNTMFSEGLLAYGIVGVDMPFFYDTDFPGEGAILAIPHTAYDLVIGIIPRALWKNKPIDALWQWYNKAFTGIGDGINGTTISHGLIGSWYFKYGLIGMIEGALLVGWLMGISERSLQHSEGKPLGILFSLGMATWLFRTFRDFIFIDLYGLILAAIVLWMLIPVMRPLFGGSNSQNG